MKDPIQATNIRSWMQTLDKYEEKIPVYVNEHAQYNHAVTGVRMEVSFTPSGTKGTLIFETTNSVSGIINVRRLQEILNTCPDECKVFVLMENGGIYPIHSCANHYTNFNLNI